MQSICAIVFAAFRQLLLSKETRYGGPYSKKRRHDIASFERDESTYLSPSKMKFSALTCLTVLVTSASVADAEWSSFFKGKTDDVGADTKVCLPCLFAKLAC